MGLQEQEICIDPKYQREGQDADKEGTYYPQGVVCYTDPSEGIIKKYKLIPILLSSIHYFFGWKTLIVVTMWFDVHLRCT